MRYLTISDIDSIFRYMEKYLSYENQQVTLNHPYEFFREMRQKEKVSVRILQTILGIALRVIIYLVECRMGSSCETIFPSTIRS
jgi:hypothetical protein